MTLAESGKKYILSGIVAFIVVGLIVANVLAGKQDEEFMMSESLYNQALEFQGNGDLDSAELMISEVLKKHPHSEVANYVAGLITAQNGNLNKAAIYMQKVLDINPNKVEDPRFMIQLGEIFVGAEKYEEAKIVLLRCQESQWTLDGFPNYQEQISTLLAQIENLQLKEGTNNE